MGSRIPIVTESGRVSSSRASSNSTHFVHTTQQQQLPQRAGGRDQGDRGHDHQDQAGRRRSRSPHHRQRDAGLDQHLGGHLALLSAKTDCTWFYILKLCPRTLSSFLNESKARTLHMLYHSLIHDQYYIPMYLLAVYDYHLIGNTIIKINTYFLPLKK